MATKKASIQVDEGPTVRDIADRYESHQKPLLNRDKQYNVANALKILTDLFGDRPALSC